MKTGWLWVTLILTGLFAAGCAESPRFTPVTEATRRIEFKGFSILPPSGKNWVADSPEVLRDMEKVDKIVRLASFSKKPGLSMTHTIIVQVITVELPPLPPSANLVEILQEIKHANFRSTARNRVVVLTVSENRALGSDCVKYDAISEDRGVARYPDSVFLLDVHGVTCVHPDRPTYAIQLEYSERTLFGESPLSTLAAEGEAFLNSLAFTRLPRP